MDYRVHTAFLAMLHTVVIKKGPGHFATWEGTVRHLGQDSSALWSRLSLGHFVTSADLSGQFGPTKLVPKCPGSEVSVTPLVTAFQLICVILIYVLYPVPAAGTRSGAFQSRQPELNVNFPVSRSPVILFHQPYSSQSIVTCMPQFPGHLNCWIISGMPVSVSDRNVTCMPICRMNCV